MPPAPHTPTPNPDKRSPLGLMRQWWLRLPPSRQDRFATLAPLLAVLLFLSAIVVAITYLRYEELEREQEAVTRDVEYAQQRLRLRLLERQEQLMRLAREVDNKEISSEEFAFQAENLISQFPELLAVSWVDGRRHVLTTYASPSAPPSLVRLPGSTLAPNETDGSFDLARDLRQPIYSRPLGEDPRQATLMLQVPLTEQGRFAGTVMGEYSVDGLLRFGIPPEIMARYAVALIDDRQRVLAGSLQSPNTVLRLLPWSSQPLEHEVPVSPVGNGLILKAQGYRTSQDIVGSGFFWVIGALSALTVWMLLGTWRHTRRRVQAQQALVAETNFRRAMENSMLTGMRALDLQGRITYVNPAFCSMTGWTEGELVGRTAPFPYWPDEDHDQLAARLEDELSGRSTPGGFEVRVQRRDGSIFDARMYVSPLIDPKGHQTGWMTSMTDITEPKRIREELSASYERFTTVLESLDSAVSVAPLGSDEMLFANKMYRLWFGTRGQGHRHLVDLAGTQPTPSPDDGDAVDAFAGMPTDTLTDAGSENAEVFVEELDRWLEVRTRYLTWVDGRLAQMVIASDITPRRTAEEQASRQAERAQTASRLITMGEMASSVAHELNQPLTAISNYCNGMISRLSEQRISNEELLSALEKTSRQAQRAGQIIQRIRAFVKRSEPNPMPSDVAQMVSNAIELADIELRRQQVRLSPYVAARLPSLMVDPILIEQVLINLLKNAGEAIAQAGRPPGERYVELRVGPRRLDDEEVVEFSVRDSGNGVPDEMIERIYEAFYSTKSEGMGIGLKLCRSIVESHHGRMQVQNIYNGEEVVGCCFSFWIPVQSRLQADNTAPAAPSASLTDTERAR
ncbi:MAG: PAS domain-containing sensor histidine kinase [Burkholderiales bacterium GWF1_66_17]|nr:PAS domain S-box protein [Gammaproteobacteria bacterium]OGA78635.1 MAG: PAS domain-containing sensor histidine kinase [Burkholderiales bacterium GWE1_65_30]OGA89208.1 MAG: PAS domain-containing sensor histidine kinase [Burkholderiales bacterium GWF1_66_17]OGB34503.1 MAG: PAS domain-containing sensor histidine kinase [Burkholderiales bacterium RIFCSPLOWO2_02_FULL_66_35]PKO74572.1 MAG: PAS domain-containing sensor histidine kinase [Betaproteobacteria bacterium HGW-Betaproteobacteria-15]